MSFFSECFKEVDILENPNEGIVFYTQKSDS